MNPQTLISVAELQALQAQRAPLVLLDCGFDLADMNAGERTYAAGHLPGAIYAHLDRDLAGARTGHNGRHPLPTRTALAQRMGAWGIAPGVPVVCHDDQGGVYAARAWWLLRWMGHADVAVLDGGRGAWLATGAGLEAGAVRVRPQAPYPTLAAAAPTVDTPTLQSRLERITLLDARAIERFRGEVEPLDPVAGHIPGATHRHFKDNLAADGRFKTAAQLRSEYAALVGAGDVVHSCGSGVTACHNLLAMAHAGLAPGALYPGSWSEWCSDPARPVARG